MTQNADYEQCDVCGDTTKLKECIAGEIYYCADDSACESKAGEMHVHSIRGIPTYMSVDEYQRAMRVAGAHIDRSEAK